MRAHIKEVEDFRKKPQRDSETIISAALVMALAQLGSLNGLEQRRGNKFWFKWIGEDIPSADTMGKVASLLDCDDVRRIIVKVYSQLKRNKALKPLFEYGFALVIDGHEVTNSYLRSCDECLERVVHKEKGDEVQYYHRYVMAQLVCGNFCLPIDIELQRPKEDEVAAAERLLKRVLENYARAFLLILVDGLYLRAGFFNLAIKHGKEVIAVLKDDRRDLLKDAMVLFNAEKSMIYKEGAVTIECWDIEHFTSWPQLSKEVRVVRSLERSSVKRQRTKKLQFEVHDWTWASTISKEDLPTKLFINIAHGRWKIENNGFNELVNYWHANHIYRHELIAIEFFLLITMLAYILFHVFIQRNLKPEITEGHTKKFFAQMITAELSISSKLLIPP